MHTVVSSATREVVIGPDQPFCLIGERINPTGRRLFAEKLRAGDLSRIEIDVAEQVAGGATMLDINMGVPLTDEAELLAKAITMVQGLTDLPICIDSSVVEALEAGLAVYQGKALVNSVTGERERLDAILPLVKRHGAAVIALPNEEDEIPEDPRKRLDITRKILDIAVGEYEIPMEDIVIDPLAMPVGADSSLVVKTLETIALIRDEFGLNMTLGASNVSFGMPRRERARRRVRADGHGQRADQRGDRRAQPADRGRGEGGRRDDGQRRVGRELDLRLPRAATRDATATGMTSRTRQHTQDATDADQGPARVRISFDPDGAPPRDVRVPAGVTRVRRGQLERHRHRLHLRRARHLPQVQGPGDSRARCRSPGSTRARSTPTSCAPAGGWPAWPRPSRTSGSQVPPLVTRPKAATVGVGRQVILRPAVQKRYVELDGADAVRPALGLAAALGRPRRPGAALRPARDAPAAAGAARRPTSRSPR